MGKGSFFPVWGRYVSRNSVPRYSALQAPVKSRLSNFHVGLDQFPVSEK